ncbi:tether containing UBX domain for GLUT4 isoform X1 [Trichogramma pretiosum]|uniref:tether containing UBX domain for GLUT4 isoform X1 n=1 Tax=Trichogramma pretiosum TaxID=7493 RepID=UPI0006C9AD4E|nr:tether containing UBX domain for GLUT4 isoform X1 [Trichogramma pretiosum]
MAAKNNITVLTPNGRRPAIEVNQNTTILEVLEKACSKYNFNPDEYDLKYHNRILDVDLTIRYANISNKACLEMVTCKNPRKVSNVTICVQLETGDRQTGEFAPTTSLEAILKNLNIEYDVETVVIVYTQRKIYGKEFENLTLRSLGLGSGKALFRLMHRNPEENKEQAHVYNIPQKPKTFETVDDDEFVFKRTPAPDPKKSKVLDPISLIKAEKESHKKCDTNINDTKTKVAAEKPLKESLSSSALKNEREDNKKSKLSEDVDLEKNEEVEDKILQEVPEVQIIGERDALLFNQAGAKPMNQNPVPDSFFEVTVNDIRALIRDARNAQNDAPLSTAAMRQRDKDNAQMEQLRKYKTVIIRIQFPSQLVLQGFFTPVETVQTIKDFVKTYLENPSEDFNLYTTPPRCDLVPMDLLIDCGLVPSAIIYYAGTSDLKPEIKSKLTDPMAASLHASNTRLSTMRQNCDLDDLKNEIPQLNKEVIVSSISSSSSSSLVPRQTNRNEPQPSSSTASPSGARKVPKWLQLSKK